ncbi:MAG: sulfatase family protein, partial [Anaerolineae bacterium]
GQRRHHRAGIPTAYHQTTWCANEAIAFMREPRQGPWLLSINPFDPHPPFDPPQEYLQMFDPEAMPEPRFTTHELQTQQAYAGIDHQTASLVDPDTYDSRGMIAAYHAQIALLDHNVGRMLDTLCETGQDRNTIVIYTSDHGEMLGDHGLLWKGCRFYEGAVHVPLIISWPGHFPAGKCTGLVELIDLVPTILEITGLDLPHDVEGESLLALLRQDDERAHHRTAVRCEYHDALDLPNASHANMLFDGRYKLVIYHGHEVGELYDLADDPDEFENLWLDQKTIDTKQRLMRQMLDALMLPTDPGQPRVGRY